MPSIVRSVPDLTSPLTGPALRVLSRVDWSTSDDLRADLPGGLVHTLVRGVPESLTVPVLSRVEWSTSDLRAGNLHRLIRVAVGGLVRVRVLATRRAMLTAQAAFRAAVSVLTWRLLADVFHRLLVALLAHTPIFASHAVFIAVATLATPTTGPPCFPVSPSRVRLGALSV